MPAAATAPPAPRTAKTSGPAQQSDDNMEASTAPTAPVGATQPNRCTLVIDRSEFLNWPSSLLLEDRLVIACQFKTPETSTRQDLIR